MIQGKEVAKSAKSRFGNETYGVLDRYIRKAEFNILKSENSLPDAPKAVKTLLKRSEKSFFMPYKQLYFNNYSEK